MKFGFTAEGCRGGIFLFSPFIFYWEQGDSRPLFGVGMSCSRFEEQALTGVYVLNSSTEPPPFLKSLGWVLESPPTDNSVLLLGDFSAYRGGNTLT